MNTPAKSSDFADLNRKVLFGKSNGKIIWQPLIGCWFGDKQFAGEPLPAPFNCSCRNIVSPVIRKICVAGLPAPL